MTELAIERVDVATLKPAPYNPRVMSAEAFEALKRGITEFGLVDPIIARREDGLVVGGHYRLRAVIALGLTIAPVVYLDGLSDERAAALNVLLNNPSAQGEWDMAKLADVLSELDAHGFDATQTGFDEEELQRILTWVPQGSPIDPNAEWEGMPEFEHEDKRAHQKIKLYFQTAADVEQFAALVGQPITPKTTFLWIPRLESEHDCASEYGPEPDA